MNLKLKTTLCAGFGMYVRQNFHLGYDDRFRGDIGWLLVTIPYGTSSLHCQMHLQCHCNVTDMYFRHLVDMYRQRHLVGKPC